MLYPQEKTTLGIQPPINKNEIGNQKKKTKLEIEAQIENELEFEGRNETGIAT